MSGRRERRVDAGELLDGDAAVGLMADDDDDVTPAERDVTHRVGRGAGCEAVIHLGLAEPERGRGFAGAEERARQHSVRLEPAGAKTIAERARLLAPLGRESAQLIGLARSGFGVSDDDESHGRGGG